MSKPIVFLVFGFLCQSQIIWNLGSPPSMPFEKAGAALGYDNITNKIYLIGGPNNMDNIYSYNLNGGYFNYEPKIGPSINWGSNGLASQGYTQINRIIYIYKNSQLMYYNIDTTIYDIESNLTGGPIDGCITSDNRDIYLIEEREFYVYTTMDGNWYNLIGPQHNHENGACEFHSNKVYAISGGDTEIESVDVTANGGILKNLTLWSNLKELPQLSYRVRSTKVTWNINGAPTTVIYIFSGIFFDPLGLVWAFFPDSNIVAAQTDKLYTFAAAPVFADTYTNRIYWFGGWGSNYFDWGFSDQIVPTSEPDKIEPIITEWKQGNGGMFSRRGSAAGYDSVSQSIFIIGGIGQPNVQELIINNNVIGHYFDKKLDIDWYSGGDLESQQYCQYGRSVYIYYDRIIHEYSMEFNTYGNYSNIIGPSGDIGNGCISVDDNNFYIIENNEFFVFSKSNQIWIRLSNTTAIHGYGSCEVVNDNFYAIGGCGERTIEAISTVNININSKWIFNTLINFGHCYTRSVVVGLNIYIFSGYFNDAWSEVDRYDILLNIAFPETNQAFRNSKESVIFEEYSNRIFYFGSWWGTYQPTNAYYYSNVIPTPSPTNSPTNSKEPTVTPSESPSKSPFQSPTIAPSKSPSELPSQSPSTTPSMGPTKSDVNPESEPPTKAPSASPSVGPTVSDVNPASEPPTKAPSTSPVTSAGAVSPDLLLPSMGIFPANDPDGLKLYIIITGFILGFLLILALIGFIYSITKRFDTFFISGILTAMIYVNDVVSDIFFVLQVYDSFLIRDDINRYLLIIMIGSGSCIIIPTILTIIQLNKSMDKWMINNYNGTQIRAWLSNWSIFVYGFSIITGSAFTAVEIVNSNLFNLQIFSMQLPTKYLRHFRYKRVVSTVIFENIPQLGFQFWYSIIVGEFTIITWFAILFSIVSVLITALSMLNHRKILRNEEYIVLSFDVTSKELFNKRETLRHQTLKIRNTVGNCINCDKNTMDVLPMLNIQDGLRIGFRIQAETFLNHNNVNGEQLHSLHIIKETIFQKLNASIENRNLNEGIKDTWKLKKSVIIGNISIYEEMSKERSIKDSMKNSMKLTNELNDKQQNIHAVQMSGMSQIKSNDDDTENDDLVVVAHQKTLNEIEGEFSNNTGYTTPNNIAALPDTNYVITPSNPDMIPSPPPPPIPPV